MNPVDNILGKNISCSNCGKKTLEYRYKSDKLETYRCKKCGSYTHKNIY